MKKWLIFFILTVQGATGAQEQMFFEPDVERTWHKMAGFGNLTGISIGGNYNPKNWLSLEAMAGFSLPYTPFMPAPYPGNQFTANLRLRLIHKTGLYLMSAYFLGSYEIRQNSGDVSVTEMSTIHAPQFALGFAWPKPPSDIQIMLELGASYGIPETLSFDEDDYLSLYKLKARRSYGSYKDYFPFFAILFQI